MIPNAYIQIKTEIFQKEDDEDSKLVNPGMYGCKLTKYLQKSLNDIGYNSPFNCNEDWGWWVEIKGFPHLMGLCIYGQEDDDGIIREYVICSGVTDEKLWSWKKFKKVDTTIAVNKLMDVIEGILKKTDGITSTTRLNDIP